MRVASRAPTAAHPALRIAIRRVCRARLVPPAVGLANDVASRTKHVSSLGSFTLRSASRDEFARRLTPTRASDRDDGETEPVSKKLIKAASTISALDALLGGASEEYGAEATNASEFAETKKSAPDATQTPFDSRRDAKATVSAPLSATRAARIEQGSRRAGSPETPATRSSRKDSDAKTETRDDDESPMATYDPEKDLLGLGPRWVVPWGIGTTFFTLLAVELGFFFSGALAPAIVYSAVRAPEEIPIDTPELFAKDLRDVFDDPGSFAAILACAEVIQTVLALSVIYAVVSRNSPLPPGWFQASLFGSDIAVDGGFSIEESEAIKKKGGVDAGVTPESAETARKKRTALSRQRRKSNDWFGEAGRAVVLTWVFVLAITALAYAVGLRGEDQGTASNSVIEKAFAAGPNGAARLVFTTVVLAPVLEETVFRGFLLPSLTRYMTVPWAVFLSTVIFAFAHEHNTGDTAQLLAVGAMTGVSYARTRNLATSVVVHASFNLGVLALFAAWTHS